LHSFIQSPSPYSPDFARPDESADKYTLRLPDHIRREIIASLRTIETSKESPFIPHPRRGKL
jgi:hypothetical protein